MPSRDPQHYPKWLREILFDSPYLYQRYILTSSRNLSYLEGLYQRDVRVTDQGSLLLDLVINYEREAIRTREEIKRLETRISDLEFVLNRQGEI